LLSLETILRINHQFKIGLTKVFYLSGEVLIILKNVSEAFIANAVKLKYSI